MSEEKTPSHDIYGLLREYERSAPGKPRIGRALRASDDVVRFGQVPHLTFAPASTDSGEVPAASAAPAFLRVFFMGLLGPMGPMPSQLSELAIYEQRYAKERPYTAFLDVLSNRMIQLFFRAWADAEPTANLDRPGGDIFQHFVGALSGFAGAAPHDEPDRIGLALLGFAGQAGLRRSPASIVDTVSTLLGVPASLVEFVGVWSDLDPADSTRLGGQHSSLGRGATAGSRVYTVQDTCLIRLHFKDLNGYQDHLPGEPSHAAALSVLKSLMPSSLDWRVEFELPGTETAPARLDRGTRLGWTGWLGKSPKGSVRRDLRLRPDAARAA